MDDTLHNLLNVPTNIQAHEVHRLARDEGFALSVLTERYGNDTTYFTSIQRLDELKDHSPRDGTRFLTEIAALLNGLRIAREANSLVA